MSKRGAHVHVSLFVKLVEPKSALPKFVKIALSNDSHSYF